MSFSEKIRQGLRDNAVYFAIGAVMSLIVIVSSVISMGQRSGKIRMDEEARKTCGRDVDCIAAFEAAHPTCWKESNGEVIRYRACLKRELKDLVVQPPPSVE